MALGVAIAIWEMHTLPCLPWHNCNYWGLHLHLILIDEAKHMQVGGGAAGVAIVEVLTFDLELTATLY